MPGSSIAPLAFPVPGGSPPREPADNLPAQYSSFVGHAQTLRVLRAELERQRLVTLIGTGGVGKTRIALRVAGELRSAFPDGVWFVELGPLADPGLVPSAVARALGVRESRNRTLTEAISERLRQRRALVVLDNCEHLIEPSAQLADTLLRTCPQLQLLVTSRQPLRLAGEQVHRVASLASPPAGVAAEQVSEYDAVRLFVDRARAADPEFSLSEHNAGVVGLICRQLDGIPLALELAAARVRGLGLEELAARLSAPLRVLVDGSRAAASRHQTMRATLDWSYQLLSPTEQRLLARLVIFVGGWSLPAAEAVCSGGPIDTAQVVDLLLALVDKSLVVVLPESSATHPRRYTLLEPSREYLMEKLAALGEVQLLRRRHAEWFQAFTADVATARRGPGYGPWLEMVEPELDNLRSALDWLVQTEAVDDGLRLADAVSLVWSTRGYLAEGRARLARLLEIPGGPPNEVRGQALLRAAQLAEFQGDYAEEASCAEQALEIFRALGDAVGIAEALSTCGSAAFQQGRYESGRVLLEESLRESRKAGHALGVGAALMRLASIQRDRGEFAAAHRAYDEALELRQRMGDRLGVHHVLSNLGWLAFYEDDFLSARSLQEASLGIRRELNDRREIAVSMSALAKVALMLGERSHARALLLESLPMHREMGNRWGVALALEGFVGLAAPAQPGRALRLAGAAAAVRNAIGRPIPPAEQHIIHAWLEEARAALPAEDAARLWSAGLALGDEAAIAEALDCPPEAVLTASQLRRPQLSGGLTRREVEVAGLIARGFTNRQIAEALVISERTAETHVEHIMGKLGLHSRAQVAAWAAGHGLLA